MGVASMYIASSSSIADGAVSEAKLAAEACSAAKMKKEGTATHVLTSNGAGAVPSYQAAAVGTQDLVKLATTTLADNTSTQIQFSGLTTDYTKFIVQYCMLAHSDVNPSAANCTLNADTTADKYENSLIQLTGASTLGGGNASGAYFNLNAVNMSADKDICSGMIEINNDIITSDQVRYVKIQGSVIATARSTPNGFWNNGAYESSDRITSVEIKTSNGHWKTGSVATIWGVK